MTARLHHPSSSVLHRLSGLLLLAGGLACLGGYAAWGSIWWLGGLVIALLGEGLLALLPALDPRCTDTPMERLIAFVGCDGSGKSTLAGDFERALGADRPVRSCYLGLGTGALGERIKHLPVIGPVTERALSRKASQTRTRGERIPGLFTALVIYLFSLARLRRFKRMLRLRRRGFVVLTDRYPQVEVPGIYDGPGLSAGTAGSWAVAKLVERERRIYQWMAGFRPDVVVRLNVDASTALARKPEHRPDLIRRKVQITPQLRFAGARIVDLDATRPYALVRAEAARIVTTLMDIPATAA